MDVSKASAIIAEKTGVKAGEVQKVVKAFLELAEKVAREDGKSRMFGVSLQHVVPAPRRCFNPKTKEVVTVTPKESVRIVIRGQKEHAE